MSKIEIVEAKLNGEHVELDEFLKVALPNEEQLIFKKMLQDEILEFSDCSFPEIVKSKDYSYHVHHDIKTSSYLITSVNDTYTFNNNKDKVYYDKSYMKIKIENKFISFYPFGVISKKENLNFTIKDFNKIFSSFIQDKNVTVNVIQYEGNKPDITTIDISIPNIISNKQLSDILEQISDKVMGLEFTVEDLEK